MNKLLDTVPASRKCSIKDATLLRRGGPQGEPAPRRPQDLPDPVAQAGLTHRSPGAGSLPEQPLQASAGLVSTARSSPEGLLWVRPPPLLQPTYAHIPPPSTPNPSCAGLLEVPWPLRLCPLHTSFPWHWVGREGKGCVSLLSPIAVPLTGTLT